MFDLRVTGSDKIDPNPGGIITAFARIGYKLTEAVADIVDNAVDAKATNILIRFFCSEDAIRRVAFVDDGDGMSDATLSKAMQFGTSTKHPESQLGKYGIGMKSASFSQCRHLSVVTMNGGNAAGRRWTVEGIREGWKCERLNKQDAKKALALDWGPLTVKAHGTAVIWDELDRLNVTGPLDASLNRLFKQLRLALGIVYHRFLESGRIRIHIDAQKYGDDIPGIAQSVVGIDPFSYSKTGNKHYPKTFKATVGGRQLLLNAHIWPPRAKGPEYSLGGTAATKQGFYFYRNDRLIQAGGWNKLREHESDPHLTLARIAVDLPPSADAAFHLDVQKSSLDVPHAFAEAVKKAKAGGVAWQDYINDADAAYRNGEEEAPENQPVVLGGGVPVRVQTRTKAMLTNGETKQRKVELKWKTLPLGVFFDIDREAQIITMNTRFRKTLTAAENGTGETLVKTLLFLLLRDEFNRERVRKDVHAWISDLNSVLVSAVEQK